MGRAAGGNREREARSRRVPRPGGSAGQVHTCSGPGCQPRALLEATALRRAFEGRISRKAEFKGRPNLFLCPHLTAPDPLTSLLKDPKTPRLSAEAGGRWQPLIAPRGEGGLGGLEVGERPSRGWGRSGTVWLWPFLDASISAVNYGFVSRAALPMPSLTLFPVWRPCFCSHLCPSARSKVWESAND